MTRLLQVLLLICALFLLPAASYASGTWEYRINENDTPEMIDNISTTAKIDNYNNEVRLPENTAGMITFWPGDTVDFVVATPNKIIHYYFDGTSYIEKVILEISSSDVGIKAVAVPEPYPELKLAAGAQIRHYSFDGTGYVRNYALEKDDMEKAYTVSSKEVGEFLSIVGDEVRRYVFDGTSMIRNTAFEPDVSELIDAEILDAGNVVTLTGNNLKVHKWDASGEPQPVIDVASDLVDPKDICVNKNKDIVMVEGNNVLHYSYEGNAWVRNDILSVTAGLNNVKAVTANDNTLDKIIVNGTEARYYRWDGTQMVYDQSMSIDIPEIDSIIYRPQAVIQSQAFDPHVETDNVRVRASHSLGEGHSVTYSVTADGVNWVTKWRVRGESDTTVCEITYNDGETWEVIGDASQSVPDLDIDREELWAEVPPGRDVKWKAVLKTNNIYTTPKIKAFTQDGVAVLLEASATPNNPIIDPVGEACFVTATPAFTWEYTDPDGDPQGYYQVKIAKKSGDVGEVLIYESGKIKDTEGVLDGGKGSYSLAASTKPDAAGPLWNSGEYEFTIQVKVWDVYGIESSWSEPVEFCVVAFERPRIAEIVSPPDGQAAPDLLDLSTHLVITPEMEEEELPRAKAGARVKLLVDSIGPLAELTTVKFPYLTLESTVKNPVVSHYPSGDNVNRWEIDFWTDAGLKKCPTGTVVQMQLTGDAGSEGVTMFDAPPYANGVLVTEGSIYEDWFVVLQGRD
jgi:hypothetical protein